MKMSTGTRILLTVYLVALIALCVFVLGTIFGLIPAYLFTNIADMMINGAFWFKFLYSAIVVVVVVVSFMLMFSGMRKTAPKTAKIALFEGGSILITVKAIEEMVEKYVREFKEVRGIHSQVISYDDYIDINIEVSVQPGVDIPEITKNLQLGLATDIQKHTGITVKQTKVVVMSIEDKLKTTKPVV